MISGANKKRTSDSLAPPLPTRAARRQRKAMLMAKLA